MAYYWMHQFTGEVVECEERPSKDNYECTRVIQKDKIDRLTAELANANNLADQMCDRAKQMETELAEARENAEIHAKRAERFDCDFWAMKGRAEQAEKELAAAHKLSESRARTGISYKQQAERYREALERIAQMDLGMKGRIAREALKEALNEK